MPPNPALPDVRVLDLSRVLAGPYCTMLLADHGAEVIKIERPGTGDGSRAWGPPWQGGESAYFLAVNRNKRSLALDIKAEEGRRVLRELALRCDVLVENFRPGTLDAYGLGYDDLSAGNPGLIYCSITGYGQDGPYRDRPGYDFMIQAHGGLMSVTGPADGEPTKVGVAIVDVSAGLFAANAILAALHHRERTGEGQRIDVSLLDSQVGCLVNVAQNFFATGETPGRYGNAHPSIVPYETMPTADGRLALAVGTDGQFRTLCDVIDRPDLLGDGRYRTNAGRVEHREALIAELRDAFRSEPTDVWLGRLVDAGIPSAPINEVPDVMRDPQIRHRGMIRRVEHPTAGPIEIVGPVAKMSATPPTVRAAPPRLGADGAAVLRDVLGYSPDRVVALEAKGVLGSPAPEDGQPTI